MTWPHWQPPAKAGSDDMIVLIVIYVNLEVACKVFVLCSVEARAPTRI